MPAARRGRVETLESADRVLRVLEAFAPNERELTLSEIAERLRLPKSSVHRLLATLSGRGYIEHDSKTHRYSMGIRLFEIGSNVIHERGLHAAVRPFLEDLALATGETCHLAVRSGTDAVYVYKLDGPSAIPMPSRIGGRAPGHATSIGKVLLAWGGAEVRRQAMLAPLASYSPNTITDSVSLNSELERVCDRGYATDLEEFELGLRCIAAPVRDITERVIAAVGLAAPAFRLTDEAMPVMIGAVIEASHSISRQLGYVRPPLLAEAPGVGA
ncbi:MAG TPA: IclR family transcriptional regulator [Candidatus Acidoferrales bacterium]|nr:IclR family transcriptional regulator [Candidatus Acidoferrales bacterium]